MLTLRSFHLFFITLSMMIAAGLGTWGLLNDYPLPGVLSLVAAVLLVFYGSYFVWKTASARLD